MLNSSATMFSIRFAYFPVTETVGDILLAGMQSLRLSGLTEQIEHVPLFSFNLSYELRENCQA